MVRYYCHRLTKIQCTYIDTILPQLSIIHFPLQVDFRRRNSVTHKNTTHYNYNQKNIIVHIIIILLIIYIIYIYT